MPGSRSTSTPNDFSGQNTQVHASNKACRAVVPAAEGEGGCSIFSPRGFPNTTATPKLLHSSPFEDEDDDEYEDEEIALQNIEDREQEHPHDINKVPIKTCALEEPVLSGRDVTGERSDQTYD
jgi:hypothetical protein